MKLGKETSASACLSCAAALATGFIVVCVMWQPATVLQSVLKPLPVLLLATTAVIWNHRFIALQMLVYSFADAAFEFPWGEPVAALLFGLGHGVFALRLVLHGPKSRMSALHAMLPVVVAGLSFAMGLRVTMGHCSSSVVSVVHISLYGAMLTCMAAMAAAHSTIAALGAFFFAFSDLIIAHCLACATCPEPLRTIVVMATYWIGCTLLLFGSSK